MGIPLASWVLVSLMNEPSLRVRHRVSDRDQARLEIHIAPPKAAGLADSHPRVQGEYDRPLILGGPIESELLSGILFAHDFEGLRVGNEGRGIAARVC